jgi:hypothetical protein
MSRVRLPHRGEEGMCEIDETRLEALKAAANEVLDLYLWYFRRAAEIEIEGHRWLRMIVDRHPILEEVWPAVRQYVRITTDWFEKCRRGYEDYVASLRKEIHDAKAVGEILEVLEKASDYGRHPEMRKAFVETLAQGFVTASTKAEGAKKA